MPLNIKEIRLQKGLTQADVAAALGVSSVVYSRYETGKRQPSIDMLIQMADIPSVKHDQAFITAVHPAEHVQNRCLAGSGRTHDDTKFTLIDRKADMIRRSERFTSALIVFAYILEDNKTLGIHRKTSKKSELEKL